MIILKTVGNSEQPPKAGLNLNLDPMLHVGVFLSETANGPFQKGYGILGTSLFWLHFIGQDVIYEDAEIAQCILRGR